MKLKLIILITILVSCGKNEPKNINGHWHFIDGQLYQTMDIEQNKGFMNKNISGMPHPDMLVNSNFNSIRYVTDGNNDTLFNYKLFEDTLFLESVNFGNTYKAIRIADCKPVNDRFYMSPLKFEIPKSEELFGNSISKRSLALELVIGEVDDEIKFSLWDKVYNKREDLENFYSELLKSTPESLIDRVFVDLYIDRSINTQKLEWLLETLNEIGFGNIYLVFEVHQNGKFNYRKTEIGMDKLENITVEQYIEKKKNMHNE